MVVETYSYIVFLSVGAFLGRYHCKVIIWAHFGPKNRGLSVLPAQTIDFEFHNSVSLNIFKNKLIKLIRPNPKSIFKLHDTVGIKIIYQLRVGLSSLKCHKKIHNFMDTPDDWCICLSAPEDTQHFLLKCTLFSVQRVTLIASVKKLLANTNFIDLIDDYKLYLYGHHSLTDNTNKNILQATVLYIKDTGRFA